MTVGDKIKKIRTFRGMTQKELGLAIGLEEKGADNRIAQYETNYRVPKRELLDKMAEALRVDRQNFYTIAPGSAEDFMRTFFWLDEDSPGAIRLFQLVRRWRWRPYSTSWRRYSPDPGPGPHRPSPADRR